MMACHTWPAVPGCEDALRFDIPPKKQKTALSDGFLFIWRWGESNPRPEVRYRGVYRFSDARWLSGSGGSTASVRPVSRLKSRPPFWPGGKQAPIGVGNPDASEQHHPVSALCLLSGESVTVVSFGSYKFYPFRGQATSPAAQASTTTVETGAPPVFRYSVYARTAYTTDYSDLKIRR